MLMLYDDIGCQTGGWEIDCFAKLGFEILISRVCALLLEVGGVVWCEGCPVTLK
jgi:hypothetical protein